LESIAHGGAAGSAPPEVKPYAHGGGAGTWPVTTAPAAIESNASVTNGADFLITPPGHFYHDLAGTSRTLKRARFPVESLAEEALQ
jgi:hypothetical protein